MGTSETERYPVPDTQPAAAAEGYRIMPVGDSITFGMGEDGGRIEDTGELAKLDGASADDVEKA